MGLNWLMTTIDKMKDKIALQINDDIVQDIIELLHEKAKSNPTDIHLSRTENYNKYMTMASLVVIARSIGLRNSGKDKVYCSKCNVKQCDRKKKKVVLESKMNSEVKNEATFTRNSFKINK